MNASKDVDKNSILKDGMIGGTVTIVDIVSFMWLRTTINHQYRYGNNFSKTFTMLYNEGGISRFYRGSPIAIFQVALIRFGDTACNSAAVKYAKKEYIFTQTALASSMAACWRMFLMPVDTVKIMLQIERKNGKNVRKNQI